MGDSDLHSISGTEIKADCSSTLPNEILVKIILELSFYDVLKLYMVCKRWYRLSCSDLVWQKFVPKYPGMHLPPEADTQKDIFKKLWVNSIKIGMERWFPNALPDLVEYDTELRKEEMKASGEMLESKCVLYLRLNPLYPFTTNGVNIDDPAMVETVQTVFNKFGNVDHVPQEYVDRYDYVYDDNFIRDAETAMQWSSYVPKKFPINLTVICLESQYCLKFKKDPCNQIYPNFDEEGYRVKSEDGPDRESRLHDKLFHQIRNVLIGKNSNFVVYFLNQGCCELDPCVFPYTRKLVVSDTAAVLCVQYYLDLEG